ncbi:unnamed protein product [Mycena citricolor]|uniref:Ribosomal RNA-processing protein 8 n=1 Tax=Mycena citricolor TaxID=2018698 RepID=A0AAD2HIW7_9AGAR|nr:unnamed protein product [Mycena citricolor]
MKVAMYRAQKSMRGNRWIGVMIGRKQVANVDITNQYVPCSFRTSAMPLFEVPGWTVTSAPLSTPTTPGGSRKRKRPSDERNSLDLDLQSLVKKHRRVDGDADASSTLSRGASRVKSLVKGSVDRKRRKKAEALEAKKKTISLPKALQPSGARKRQPAPPSPSSSVSSAPEFVHPSESEAMQLSVIEEDSVAEIEMEDEKPPAPPTKSESRLTAMQATMKKSLEGARFRMINETLYKTDSKRAHDMMRQEPSMFEDYHSGFRHQVQSWPTNPVQHYISLLSRYPSRTVIADLGCGDAAMAQELGPKGLNVLSFDLVSDGTYVVEADICERIPMPGSEPTEGGKSEGKGQVVDVAICALSLMGTNWPNCIREAWRILKPGGELKIAEVASRFTDVDEFINVVTFVGFKLKSKNDSNSHFTLFEFVKVSRTVKKDKEWTSLMARGNALKPCEYKRR